MPAKIIETNSTPLQTVEVDGVTIDIIENALKMPVKKWTRFCSVLLCLPVFANRAIVFQ